MKFADIRKIAFDTETTGPNPNEDRIVTAALIVRGGGRDDNVMSWLINPGPSSSTSTIENRNSVSRKYEYDSVQISIR